MARNIGPYQGDGGSNIGPWQNDSLPIILSHPVNYKVRLGNSAVFRITASGDNLTYQWYLNGQALPGQTGTSIYFITQLYHHAARVHCAVTNDMGSVQSTNAYVIIYDQTLIFTDDDYFSKKQPAKREEMKNRVEVQTQPLLPVDTPEEIYRTGEPVTLSAGQVSEVTAYYSTQPALVSGASISIENNEGGTIVIAAVEYYPWGVEYTVSNTSGVEGSAEVVVNGYPLKITGEETIVREDTGSIEDYGLQKYAYKKNHLVQSAAMAARIAGKLLDAYSIFRKDVSVTWRGNPNVELGDEITVPVYDTPGTYIVDRFKVFRNKLEYDGTLKQITDARKVFE